MYISPVTYTVAIQLVLLDYYFHSSLRPLSCFLYKEDTLAEPSSETECFSVTCLRSALVADTSLTVHLHFISLAYRSAEYYRYIRTSSFSTLLSILRCAHQRSIFPTGGIGATQS